MDKISHIGTVVEIGDEEVEVRILQASACEMCHAKTICASAETKEKLIRVRRPARPLAIGDTVTVEGSASMGMKAVGLAYVLPMLLVVAVLVLCLTWIAPGNEPMAAIASLAVLLPYAAVLYALRHRLRTRFHFEIRDDDKDSDNLLTE